MVKTWASTTEAKKYLDSLGLSKKLSPRNKSLLLKQMQKESLEADGFSPDYLKIKSKSTIADDQFEAAKNILEKKIEEKTGGIIGSKFGEVKDEKKT
jgi:hypothetical protein